MQENYGTIRLCTLGVNLVGFSEISCFLQAAKYLALEPTKLCFGQRI